MESKDLYCVMDDSDLELDPSEMTDEIKEVDAKIDDMIREKHPELFV